MNISESISIQSQSDFDADHLENLIKAVTAVLVGNIVNDDMVARVIGIAEFDVFDVFSRTAAIKVLGKKKSLLVVFADIKT